MTEIYYQIDDFSNIRQPAAQSKLRELRQRARSACFVPVAAINKPDFLAGYSLFYESARYRGDFLAAIENNLDFYVEPDCRGCLGELKDQSKLPQKKETDVKSISFRVPSGIRTHDIQNHNLTL